MDNNEMNKFEGKCFTWIVIIFIVAIVIAVSFDKWIYLKHKEIEIQKQQLELKANEK